MQESHWPYGAQDGTGRMPVPHAQVGRGCIRGRSQGVCGGVHCACKCQGLSTLSSSSTAEDDEGAVRPQVDEDGARMVAEPVMGAIYLWRMKRGFYGSNFARATKFTRMQYCIITERANGPIGVVATRHNL